MSDIEKSNGSSCVTTVWKKSLSFLIALLFSLPELLKLPLAVCSMCVKKWAPQKAGVQSTSWVESLFSSCWKKGKENRSRAGEEEKKKTRLRAGWLTLSGFKKREGKNSAIYYVLLLYNLSKKNGRKGCCSAEAYYASPSRILSLSLPPFSNCFFLHSQSPFCVSEEGKEAYFS